MKYFANLWCFLAPCLASQLVAATAAYHLGVAVVAQAQHGLFDPAAVPECLKDLSQLLLKAQMKRGSSYGFVQAAQQGWSADVPEFREVFKKAVDFYKGSTDLEKVKTVRSLCSKDSPNCQHTRLSK